MTTNGFVFSLCVRDSVSPTHWTFAMVPLNTQYCVSIITVVTASMEAAIPCDEEVVVSHKDTIRPLLDRPLQQTGANTFCRL